MKAEQKLQQQIEDYCNTLGLDTIGFLPCRPFEELREFYEIRQKLQLQNEFEEKDIEKRINPNLSMENGKTIISIAFPYYDGQEAYDNGFSVYTKRLDYHQVVGAYLDKICVFIESLGGMTKRFVDSNVLPERYIAYLSGVGFIGRNQLLITQKYGSYVFLGEIITDLKIGCREKRAYCDLSKHEECGKCNRCQEECPTKAISTEGTNPNICLSYITQKKELSNEEITKLKGNVFGCDYCQVKCPYNLKAVRSTLPEFKTLSCMNEPIENYAGMNNKYFKENISKTSCGWRGKNVIIRNALIRMSSEHKEIDTYTGTSPYLNDYITRLNEITNPESY